jgi:preprotein translocase subunit SecA
MGPILRDLGFRVGCITSDSTPDQRLREYGCEITYGTLREFAFDYLRQSIAIREEPSTPSAPTFRLDVLIIDEADSVLIDEARTPMIITAIITTSSKMAALTSSMNTPGAKRAKETLAAESIRRSRLAKD